ncbi:MAG: anhydro-N-acetylmuramic acid kinase [Proteobacteria bacterium]|nr:anhydro-N-acetylmuramic acid kinase [Pseudomonadota bacterium]
MNNVLSLYIGLMSGTSMDGIDAVLVAFDNSNHQVRLIASHLQEIPQTLKQETLDITLGESDANFKKVAALDIQFGQLFAQSVAFILQKAQIKKENVTAIGSHGQTLWHHPYPPFPYTVQIGCPNVIAKRTGITTVADFRRGDLALQGQGAPFVPPFHQWLTQGFKEKNTQYVFLNIGGIANISLFPNQSTCLGFDTGPGNGLMDAWIFKQRQQAYDNQGAFANEGQVHAALLTAFLSDPYFAKLPPKSTGKDYFNLDWLKKYLTAFPAISSQDVQATLLELTASTIAFAILQHHTHAQILVCGGGSYNPILMNAVQRHLGPTFIVKSTESYGLAPEWIEATCFAWYAKQRLENKSIDLTCITGASKPTILGAIYAP